MWNMGSIQVSVFHNFLMAIAPFKNGRNSKREYDLHENFEF